MSNDRVIRRRFLAGAAATGSLAPLLPIRATAQDKTASAHIPAHLPELIIRNEVPLQEKPFLMFKVRLLPSHWQDMTEALVPLSDISDTTYSIYLRNAAAEG